MIVPSGHEFQSQLLAKGQALVKSLFLKIAIWIETALESIFTKEHLGRTRIGVVARYFSRSIKGRGK